MSVRIRHSGLAVWLKCGNDLLKYPTNPSILHSSVIDDGFFFNFDDAAMIFLGSAVKPADDMIQPRYEI